MITLFLVACKETDIQVYNTPKETPKESLAMASKKDHDIRWKSPSNWEELPKSNFRIGNYKVSKGNRSAELSISPLPKGAGSLGANINRWRGQLQLPPQTQEELQKEIKTKQINNKVFTLVEITSQIKQKNNDVQKMLISIVTDHDTTYFIKFNGSSSVINSEKKNFISFLETIKFHD